MWTDLIINKYTVGYAGAICISYGIGKLLTSYVSNPTLKSIRESSLAVNSALVDPINFIKSGKIEKNITEVATTICIKSAKMFKLAKDLWANENVQFGLKVWAGAFALAFVVAFSANIVAARNNNNIVAEKIAKISGDTMGYLAMPVYGTYRLIRWTIFHGIPKILNTIDWFMVKICRKIVRGFVNLVEFVKQSFKKLGQGLDWLLQKALKVLEWFVKKAVKGLEWVLKKVFKVVNGLSKRQ